MDVARNTKKMYQAKLQYKRPNGETPKLDGMMIYRTAQEGWGLIGET
jgi:hypothetical protein